MRRTIVAGTVLLATLALSAPAMAHHGGVTVLSSRPDQVSGGDALVRVDVRRHHRLRILRNGDDVTPAFSRHAGGALVGLVDGRTSRTPTASARTATRARPGTTSASSTG
jgi:uncharacterized tannase-like protein DUF6351